MTANLSLNLQLIQSASGMASNNSVVPQQNSKPAVYAKEGDPNYNEEMDLDKDGIVTMEEYQKYCEENNINTEEEQIQTVQNKVDAMLEKNTGSYDDYIEYCEKNETSSGSIPSNSVTFTQGENEAGIIIHNVGQAFTSYANTNINFPEMKIERNA